jgi:hypothetical protein
VLGHSDSVGSHHHDAQAIPQQRLSITYVRGGEDHVVSVLGCDLRDLELGMRVRVCTGSS